MSNPLASAATWDAVADAYADEAAPTLARYAADAFAAIAPAAGSRVLDVACGPGQLARLAAAAGHPVDAIDLAPQMIARLNVPGITAIVGDGQALPYADRTFCGAASLFGLIFFPDRAAGLRELARVLVPGARAALTSWQPLGENRAMAAMHGALRPFLPPAPPAPLPMTTADECRAEMSAYFADVEVRSVVHADHFADAGAMWEMFARTMPRLVLMRRAHADRWPEIAAAARAAIADAVGPGPCSNPMPAWLTVGTSA